MRKGFNRLLGLIVAMIFLTGCTAGTTTKQKEDSASQVIRLMSMTELTSLDPAAMLDFPDAIIQTATFEGLYLLDEKDEVQPGVAVDLPEISSDGKTYRFRLRENAQWSNGDPVTANDFEYAWKRMIDPENAFQYSFLMNGLIENAEEIARGDQSADTLGVEAKVVKNWQQTEMNWDLAKNESYWDQEAILAEEIHYDVVKESATALNLYEDGQLDVAIISGEIAKQMQSSDQFASYPSATMNYIRLNQERKGQPTPLQNENLRKALALAIDKENLVNNIMADGSKPLNGAITEGFVANPDTGVDFREEAGDLMAYDKEKALAYWEQAKAELGDEIELDLLTTDDGSYKKMGESIQWSLEDLFTGLKVNMRSLPAETALNLASESDYDLFLIYWTPDYQDPYSTLKMMYSGNNRHYSNPFYDRLLDDASTTYALDENKRWETMIAAEKELMETTAGMIVISQNQNSVLQNPSISGLNYHTFAAPMTLRNLVKNE